MGHQPYGDCMHFLRATHRVAPTKGYLNAEVIQGSSLITGFPNLSGTGASAGRDD